MIVLGETTLLHNTSAFALVETRSMIPDSSVVYTSVSASVAASAGAVVSSPGNPARVDE